MRTAMNQIKEECQKNDVEVKIHDSLMSSKSWMTQNDKIVLQFDYEKKQFFHMFIKIHNYFDYMNDVFS
jgi:hypothetical protein